MNIYDFATENDMFEAQVINVGIGIDAVEASYCSDSWACSPEELTNILTWGCADTSIMFTYADNENTFSANKIRRVDLKNKTHWLD
jgi:hypothetical protein